MSCLQAPQGLDCCCCKRCNYAGCDLKVLPCNCCLHARCAPRAFLACPICFAPLASSNNSSSNSHLYLIPMKFNELDEAQRQAMSTSLTNKRGKKRQNATVARLNPQLSDSSNNGSSTLRMGRWTPQETAFCDKLMQLFDQGALPIPPQTKLNDFLASMLKSKQSRLTKKMKFANLSARQYVVQQGYISDLAEAAAFSKLETEFFQSINCSMERAELKFHMQKEWRELYSRFCLSTGIPLNVDDWLDSVSEIDRRVTREKEMARHARRQLMVGQALSQDLQQLQERGGVAVARAVGSNGDLATASGVFIDQAAAALSHVHPSNSLGSTQQAKRPRMEVSPHPHALFAEQIMQYVQRHSLPFEHCDIWVPSIFSASTKNHTPVMEPSVRLCFAGSASAQVYLPPIAGSSSSVTLSDDEQFDLVSFGKHSQNFSFDIGSGLLGRVYTSGISSWEQGIQNAPSQQFERCGGAHQFNIQTVLGIPVPSPKVGRLVVVFYSKYDREKSQQIVYCLSSELQRLMPSPKWKLIVEVGANDNGNAFTAEELHARHELLVSLQAHTPENKDAPYAEYLPGFAALKLLLEGRSQDETERDRQKIDNALTLYTGYKGSGHRSEDAAWMVARDCMTLWKTSPGTSTATSLNGSRHSQMKGNNESLYPGLFELASSLSTEYMNGSALSGSGCC